MNQMTPERRHDLDWLRIIAIGLLIFYHIGMFYVSWDWHVKSPRASDWAEPLMLILNPWRLDLLFLISGIASRYMLDKMTPAQFALSRVIRLLIPLVFAMLVIVPPQSYLEILDAMRLGQIDSFNLTYSHFYARYLTGYNGWCDSEGCLTVPTWNHMWFVAYLLVYSVIIAVLWPLLRRMTVRLPFWSFVCLPWLFMWGLRVMLMPHFGQTHALIDDIYLHALYGSLFLLGVLCGKSEPLIEGLRQRRWIWLEVALISYGLYIPAAMGWFSLINADLWVYIHGIREAQAWFAILALLGFARQHLSHRNGPLRKPLTEAVFPFYIVHQTLIVIAAYYLATLNLALWLEFGLLTAITIVGCISIYLLVRPLNLIRPLFGLKRLGPQ